jgi:heme exporter protein A
VAKSADLLLRANALQLRRGERWIAPSIDLILRRGAQLVIEGENGSGKSTLLRALAGIHTHYSGHCVSDARIAYVGHRHALKDMLSLERNLHWYCVLREVSPHGIKTCLHALGLSELANRPVGQLSAGQRQRAALARLPLSEAPIWLIDEPESALDEYSRGLLDDLLLRHLAYGGGVVRTLASSGALRVTASYPEGVGTQVHMNENDRQQRHSEAEDTVLRPLRQGVSLVLGLCRRDGALLWHEHRVWRMPLLLLLATSLPALVVVFDRAGLQQITPVLFWSLTLLIMFSGGDELCARDREDDILAQLCLVDAPLWQVGLARIMALWLTLALIMALMSLPIALWLGLPIGVAGALALSLLAAGPALAALSAMSGALVAPLGGRATLAAMLSLPLALPLLLFGVITVELAVLEMSILPSLALLSAFSLGACMLLPAVIAMGWRVASSV